MIASGGKALARVVPTAPDALAPWVPGTPRPFGLWKGRVGILPGFDDPLDPEDQAAFDGDGRLWPDDP